MPKIESEKPQEGAIEPFIMNEREINYLLKCVERADVFSVVEVMDTSALLDFWNKNETALLNNDMGYQSEEVQNQIIHRMGWDAESGHPGARHFVLNKIRQPEFKYYDILYRMLSSEDDPILVQDEFSKKLCEWAVDPQYRDAWPYLYKILARHKPEQVESTLIDASHSFNAVEAANAARALFEIKTEKSIKRLREMTKSKIRQVAFTALALIAEYENEK